MHGYCIVHYFTESTISLDSTSSADEGASASVCIEIASAAASLGCDLEVILDTSVGKAGK